MVTFGDPLKEGNNIWAPNMVQVEMPQQNTVTNPTDLFLIGSLALFWKVEAQE